jgi:hypothetical protein
VHVEEPLVLVHPHLGHPVEELVNKPPRTHPRGAGVGEWDTKPLKREERKRGKRKKCQKDTAFISEVSKE